jgi:hypothetical protein
MEPIRLFVENPERVDATAGIRWCIHPSVFQKLHDRGITEPHLFLVIRPEEGETRGIEDRVLVPLTQEMEFVSFRRSGRNVIRAVIIWNRNPEKPLFEGLLDRHTKTEYMRTLLRDDGFDCNYLDINTDQQYLDKFGQLEVSVDQRFFAKRPFDWKWVNTYFELPSRDQCQFRRRRLFAYTVQPVLVVLIHAWLLLKSTVGLIAWTVHLLCGKKNLSLAPVRHPITEDLRGIWSRSRVHPFFCNKWGDLSSRAVLLPIWAVLALGLTLLAYWIIPLSWRTWVPGGIYVMTLGAFGLGVVVKFISPVFDYVVDKVGSLSAIAITTLVAYWVVVAIWGATVVWITAWTVGLAGFALVLTWLFTVAVLKPRRHRHAQERALREEIGEEEWQRRLKEARKLMFLEAMQPLVCAEEEQSRPAVVAALRPESRTAYLRFKAAKAKVCKPFTG